MKNITKLTSLSLVAALLAPLPLIHNRAIIRTAPAHQVQAQAVLWGWDGAT